jgi:hypothetical protein
MQRLQITILLRRIPTVRLLQARELDAPGKNRLSFTLYDITSATDGEITSAVSLDRGKGALPVLGQLVRIGDF